MTVIVLPVSGSREMGGMDERGGTGSENGRQQKKRRVGRGTSTGGRNDWKNNAPQERGSGRTDVARKKKNTKKRCRREP